MKHASQKIKLLLFCGSLNIGGTERNVVNIAKWIDKSKFDVHVYSYFSGGPLEKELKSHGIPYTIGGLKKYEKDIGVHRSFLSFIKKTKPGIIHFFNYPTIHIGIILSKLVGASKTVVAVQAWDAWKKRSQIMLDRLLKSFVDLYIADSEGAREFAIIQQRLSPSKIITLYDGVDIDPLTPFRSSLELKNEIGISNSGSVVGVIARLQDEHKGQSFFIKSIPLIIKKFPKTNFLIVGDGEDLSYLKNLTRELGISGKVTFTGCRTDLANIISIIDIIVIPSIRWESITKTMLEAMAMKKPVIVTTVGDAKEVIEDGINGLIVPPRDPESIANAVGSLLSDTELFNRIGQRAKETIFSKNLIIVETIKLLENAYFRTVFHKEKFLKNVFQKFHFLFKFIIIVFGVYCLYFKRFSCETIRKLFKTYEE